MKKLIWILAVVFALYIGAFSQGEPSQMTVMKDIEQEKRKQKRSWRPSAEISFTSEVTTPNGVELLESSSANTAFRFVNISGKQTTWLQTKLGKPMKRDQTEYFYGFAVGTSRDLDNFQVTADAEVGYSRHFNYGRVGGKIAKHFGGEKIGIEPFMRMDFYFPIDNFGRRYSYDKVTKGVAWTGGVESKWKSEQLFVSNRTEFIYDTGSIQPNRRTLLNTEFEVGFQVGRICFGPKIGYLKPWSSRPIHIRNGFGTGFFIRYN